MPPSLDHQERENPGCYAIHVRPQVQVLAYKFRAVVDPNGFGHAVPARNPIQGVDNVRSAIAHANINRRRQPTKGIHNRQNTGSATIEDLSPWPRSHLRLWRDFGHREALQTPFYKLKDITDLFISKKMRTYNWIRQEISSWKIQKKLIKILIKMLESVP